MSRLPGVITGLWRCTCRGGPPATFLRIDEQDSRPGAIFSMQIGDRLMAGLRALVPPIEVRILVPERMRVKREHIDA